MIPRTCAFAILLSACGTVAPPPITLDAGRDDVPVADVSVADVPAPDVVTRTGPCEDPITALTGAEGHPSFYRQMLSAEGVPVLASARTSEVALRAACRITRSMTSRRTDLRDEMIARGARVAVVARDERTLEIPEHADLQREFPGTDWNARARGLGGTVSRPATSCAEENLRCDLIDRYRGENILVHELAHGIFNPGVVFAIPDFSERLARAFNAARSAGRWSNPHASHNHTQYFAEGATRRSHKTILRLRRRKMG